MAEFAVIEAADRPISTASQVTRIRTPRPRQVWYTDRQVEDSFLL